MNLRQQLEWVIVFFKMIPLQEEEVVETIEAADIIAVKTRVMKRDRSRVAGPGDVPEGVEEERA